MAPREEPTLPGGLKPLPLGPEVIERGRKEIAALRSMLPAAAAAPPPIARRKGITRRRKKKAS